MSKPKDIIEKLKLTDIHHLTLIKDFLILSKEEKHQVLAVLKQVRVEEINKIKSMIEYLEKSKSKLSDEVSTLDLIKKNI